MNLLTALFQLKKSNTENAFSEFKSIVVENGTKIFLSTAVLHTKQNAFCFTLLYAT